MAQFLHSAHFQCAVLSWIITVGVLFLGVCQSNRRLLRSLQMFLTPWWLFTARQPLGDLPVSRSASQSLSPAHYSLAWRFSFIALYYQLLINHLNPSLVSNSKRRPSSGFPDFRALVELLIWLTCRKATITSDLRFEICNQLNSQLTVFNERAAFCAL